jgi:hypothetical protein
MNLLEQDFVEFHAKNPHVYKLFDQFTKALISRGYAHQSADVVLHRIRWETLIETTDDTFKINNNYSAYYARLWMRDNPTYKGFFRTRVLLNGEADLDKTTPGGKHVNDISPPTTNVEQVVAAYVQLRDWIAEQKRLYEERVEPRKQQLEQLNSILLRYLNETNQTAARTAAGTAYKKAWTSATVADKEAFRRHVIGSEAWDLIDWRANKTAVTEAVETYGDPPPGINFSRGYDVGVRRPGKDD